MEARLIQVNCWQGRLSAKLLQFIERVNPDFICAQEIYNSDSDTCISNGEFNLGRQIREVSGGNLRHTYFSPTHSIDIAGEERPYGNMIFSRWPFLTAETVTTFGEPQFHTVSNDPSKNVAKNLQIVTVRTGGGGMFCLANHHGYVARGEDGHLGDAESERCMRRIAESLGRFAAQPLIFAGDMNVSPESKTMQIFNGSLRNLTEENDVATTLSPLHRFAGSVACDQILVNDGVKTLEFTVCKEELVSDHLPLILDFEIR